MVTSMPLVFPYLISGKLGLSPTFLILSHIIQKFDRIRNLVKIFVDQEYTTVVKQHSVPNCGHKEVQHLIYPLMVQ